MSALEDLKAAQFMLGPMYCDWVWQERIKAAPPVPRSKMRIQFRWRSNPKIVDIASKRNS